MEENKKAPCEQEESTRKMRMDSLRNLRIDVKCYATMGKKTLLTFESLTEPSSYADCLADALECILYFCESHDVDFNSVLGRVAKEVAETMESLREEALPAEEQAIEMDYVVELQQSMEWTRKVLVWARSEQEAEEKVQRFETNALPGEGATISGNRCFVFARRYERPLREALRLHREMRYSHAVREDD